MRRALPERHLRALGGLLALGLAACTTGVVGDDTVDLNDPYLTWYGNDNADVVIDATGGRFRFAANNGCLYAQTTGVGPSGFCLTASASSATGFAGYGPTGCANPTTNAACDRAGFDVVLTPDPANASGCIAVIGDGAANATVERPIAVTAVSGGFDVQGQTSATAFTTYWNGVIPYCDGVSPYAGSYAGTYTSIGYVVGSSACSAASGQGTSTPLAFTIDTGGIIDDDTADLTGLLGDAGTGSFTAPDLSSTGATGCTPTFTIASAAKNGAGKWVLSGSYALAGATSSFTATQR